MIFISVELFTSTKQVSRDLKKETQLRTASAPSVSFSSSAMDANANANDQTEWSCNWFFSSELMIRRVLRTLVWFRFSSGPVDEFLSLVCSLLWPGSSLLRPRLRPGLPARLCPTEGRPLALGLFNQAQSEP